MTALPVGPLPTVEFRGGGVRYNDPNPPKVAYEPPANTMDPRYEACTDHHVACDCREALMAENLGEYRWERDELARVCAEVLAGHPTVDDDGPGCQCTGCQIARAAHLPWWRWQR